MKLDMCSTKLRKVPDLLSGVFTPLQLPQWESLLSSHPDREYVSYLLKGIHEGFRIGFEGGEGEHDKLKSARKNMQSASDNPHVVTDYLRAELERGVLLGPFSRTQVKEVHVNRFGVIPKSGRPGKWRMIVDLSHPEGHSVNDGIRSELCSLQYVRVDDVARKLCELGPGALMAKMDIKSAYRIVPVHPHDRVLLGMQWEERVYVDAALPFGLRSAPKIFNALADALEWIVKDCGVQYLWHYLDDFITCAQGDTDQCAQNLQLLLEICRRLGIPIAVEKVEGPAALLVFLGILIDTIKGELRLPQEKLVRLLEMLSQWLGRKRCTKRELLSIAGHLQHAAKVVRPGRTFVRRLFDLSTTVKKPHHHVNLNREVRSDLAWWHQFLVTWNGVSFLESLGEQKHTVCLTSDASGHWGCGAYWECGWFQLAWEEAKGASELNIATKELIPIVLSAAVWGRAWTRQVVLCRCDNSAVVAVLNSRTSRDGDLMHLLRCLAFFEAKFGFRLMGEHIPGKLNSLADDLSRNNVSRFIQGSQVGQAAKQTTLPQSLIDLLIVHKPDWTSPSWKRMFSDIWS